MKTMNKLILRFNRMHTNYSAYLDKIESYIGCYRVCITDNEYNLSSWYIFSTCKEFYEWMKGVAL